MSHEVKVCKTCKLAKGVDSFYPNGKYLSSKCIQCTKVKSNSYYVICHCCNATTLSVHMSEPDNRGLIFCNRCIEPAYGRMDLYNKYIDLSTKLNKAKQVVYECEEGVKLVLNEIERNKRGEFKGM